MRSGKGRIATTNSTLCRLDPHEARQCEWAMNRRGIIPISGAGVSYREGRWTGSYAGAVSIETRVYTTALQWVRRAAPTGEIRWDHTKLDRKSTRLNSHY